MKVNAITSLHSAKVNFKGKEKLFKSKSIPADSFTTNSEKKKNGKFFSPEKIYLACLTVLAGFSIYLINAPEKIIKSAV